MDWAEDDWDFAREQRRNRRPSPPRRVTDSRRSQQFLDPGMLDGGGLSRTRSQGARPNPIIINNELIQDNYQRSPPSWSIPYPPSPDMRGRNRLGDELVDDFVGLALENQRLRSRSRGRSDVGWVDRRDDWYEAELRRKERQLAELERKASYETERQRMKQEIESQAVKEKEEKKRLQQEFERKKWEEEEERKDEEKRIRDKIKREEMEKKEKEEKEWEEFMQKWRAKEEKKKEEERKKKEELDEAFRLRMLNMGYSTAYVERLMAEEKLKSNQALVPAGRIGAPTYVKVHREYLSIDTLRYFNLPWEYDRKDKNYIIILREMDKSETELLFEHTKSLRQGKLLLEAPKKEKQFAWVRKRDRSNSQVKKLSIVKFDEQR